MNITAAEGSRGDILCFSGQGERFAKDTKWLQISVFRGQGAAPGLGALRSASLTFGESRD